MGFRNGQQERRRAGCAKGTVLPCPLQLPTLPEPPRARRPGRSLARAVAALQPPALPEPPRARQPGRSLARAVAALQLPTLPEPPRARWPGRSLAQAVEELLQSLVRSSPFPASVGQPESSL